MKQITSEISDKRTFLIVTTVFIFLVVTSVILVDFSENRPTQNLLTSEDCNYHQNFGIRLGNIDYFPNNETALIEIASTRNMNQKYLKSVQLYTIGGKSKSAKPTKIKIGNKTSSEGLIAKSNGHFLEKYFKNESNSATEFPLEPLNITVLGGNGDDDSDGNIGVERGEAIQLKLHQQDVTVKGYCRPYTTYFLFRINESGNIIKGEFE